jgi:hypothetical protein
MRLRGLVLCAALSVLSVAFSAAGILSVAAEIRIANDRGGQIGRYLQNFALLRSSGQRVVIDGNCLSACTLVLGVIPHSRICATARARFGFHAAWMPDGNGRPVTSSSGTKALWDFYPTAVRNWINRHGGLSRKMIFLQGDELSAIVPLCTHGPSRMSAHAPPRGRANGPPRSQASLRRNVGHGPVRYVAGNAANDRH